MKSFYLNLLVGAPLLGAVALSSPLKAGKKQELDQSNRTITVRQQVELTQEAVALSFKDLPPHMFVRIAKDLSLSDFASLIQVEKGLINMTIKGGYNPNLSLIVKTEKPWKNTTDFMESFSAQYGDRLSVTRLENGGHIWGEKSLEYTLFIMAHASQKYNLNLTVQNVLAVKANPRGDHSGKHLAFANLSDMEGAINNMYRGNLSGANLTGAWLGGNLRKANLENADLSNGDVSANYERANLKGANLSGSNLLGARMYKANLSGANLKGASVNSVNFEKANLSGADMSDSSLGKLPGGHTYVSGANLTGAIMSPEQKAYCASRGAIVD